MFPSRFKCFGVHFWSPSKNLVWHLFPNSISVCCYSPVCNSIFCILVCKNFSKLLMTSQHVCHVTCMLFRLCCLFFSQSACPWMTTKKSKPVFFDVILDLFWQCLEIFSNSHQIFKCGWMNVCLNRSTNNKTPTVNENKRNHALVTNCKLYVSNHIKTNKTQQRNYTKLHKTNTQNKNKIFWQTKLSGGSFGSPIFANILNLELIANGNNGNIWRWSIPKMTSKPPKIDNFWRFWF